MTKKPTAAAMPDPYFESDDGRFRLYQGDCLALLPLIPDESVDVIFADPPYFLSNDGITCHAGRMVSVNKGRWDKSQGPLADHEFCLRWLDECRRIVKPTGSVWVSGTMHIIHSVGFAMQRLGYKLLNDITWVKPNPPPNLSCRYFTRDGPVGPQEREGPPHLQLPPDEGHQRRQADEERLGNRRPRQGRKGLRQASHAKARGPFGTHHCRLQ